MDKIAIPLKTECPRCLARPIDMTWTEPPMLVHGGYGEATRITVAVCDCGTREIRRESVSPRDEYST